MSDQKNNAGSDFDRAFDDIDNCLAALWEVEIDNPEHERIQQKLQDAVRRRDEAANRIVADDPSARDLIDSVIRDHQSLSDFNRLLATRNSPLAT